MDSGKTTILNLEPHDDFGPGRGDRMLRAVREAAAGVYDLLGELGRNRYGSIVYLGREIATGGLTALKLDASRDNPNELELTVAAELDESIPALGYECHYCGQQLDSWGRFCTACGRDVSGVTTTERMVPLERQELLGAVREAAAGEYEILGEMQRARGGGIVYFARELATDHIIALRLQREKKAGSGEEAEYSLGRTQVLKPLVEGSEHRDPMKPAGGSTWEPPKSEADNSAAQGPELARGEVTEQPAPEKESTPPPVVPPRRNPIRRQHVVMAAVGLGVLIAIGAVIATSRDEQPPKVVQIEPPPPPPPPPEPPPPPPPTIPDSGELVLERLPPGARVVVDGAARKGSTFKLPVGKHLVEATAPGYYRAKLEIEIPPGQTRRGLKFIQLPDTSKKVVTGQQSGTQNIEPPTPTCASAASAADWTNARTLCSLEARVGSAAAERQMGVMFLRGLGGPMDEDAAVTWLQRSAARGDRDSEYDLGRIFQTSPRLHNDQRALDYLTRAANQGHRDAEFQLGRIHEKGVGTPKNLNEAFRWFRAAAEQGHAEAQTGLALFYMKEQGTRRDDTKALEWLRKGADNGSSTAMYYLGVFYEEGRAGLPKSRTEARAWYQKSADRGNSEAKKALGRN